MNSRLDISQVTVLPGRVAVAAVENNTDITVTLRLGVAQATCGDRLVKVPFHK